MKSCFIINYWADTEDKVNMVCNLLTQLRKTNIDLVYTSLTPINKNLSDLVKYSLYHNDNDLITLFDILNHDGKIIYNTESYFLNDSDGFFSVPLNYYDVSFAVIKQLRINLNYLRDLGYTHFHCMVGDCSINDCEITKFKDISNFCRLLNKKAYFDDLTGRFDGYGGIYFFSEIDFFIDKLPKAKNKIEYIDKCSVGNTLPQFETVIKNHFISDEKYLLLGNNNGLNPIVFLTESEIDIISTYHVKRTKFFIVPSKDKLTIDFYAVINDNENYEVIIDDSLIFNLFEKDNFWFLHKLKKEPFKLKIKKNGKIIIDEELNEIVLNKLTEVISFYS